MTPIERLKSTPDEMRQLLAKYGMSVVTPPLTNGEIKKIESHKPNGIHSGVKRRWKNAGNGAALG